MSSTPNPRGKNSTAIERGTDLAALTVAQARILLFPELTDPAEADEIWPPRTLPAGSNPGAHELDEAVAVLARPRGYPSNRAPRGRPAPHLREQEQLTALRVECPWYQARAGVLNAVRFAARDAERARVVAEEIVPRMRRREAEARRLSLSLRAFIGGEFMADALAEGPHYGAIPDLLDLCARGERAMDVAGELLQASLRFEEIACRSEAQRAEIAPKIAIATVWKRAFSAGLCGLWVTLTGARPSSDESGKFLALASAAIATLGGNMDADFPMGTQVREIVEREVDRPEHGKFDLREKLFDPNHIATEKAPVSFNNPDGDDSTFNLVRRIVRQIEDGGGKVH